MNEEFHFPRAAGQASEYEQYYVPSVLLYATPLLLERAAPHTGERVLDVACGTGIAARMAAPMVEPRGEVTGLDIDPEMLAVARRSCGNENILWKEGRAENLPFGSRAFDLVLCQHGLEFMTDRQAALQEMWRVLDRGGRAAICVWQPLAQNPVMQMIEETISRNINQPASNAARAFSCGDRDEVTAWLITAGFNQIRIYPVTHPVSFKDPPRFIQLTLRSRAAAVPVYANEKTPFRKALYNKIAYEIAWLVQRFTSNNTLSFNMSANIFVANR
ncbi:MAG TPA: methyltransferase domain-containing protein [Anaerolineales bacterium]